MPVRALFHWAVSNVQVAPPPAFSVMTLGSIAHSRFLMLAVIEPAAPSDMTPASARVAKTSLASRPVRVRLWLLKMRSQLRAVMLTSLILHTIESAATAILFPREMIRPLPSNRRDIARLSNGPSRDPWEATTAANASADGPLADAADAEEKLTNSPIAQQTVTAASSFTRDVKFMYASPRLVPPPTQLTPAVDCVQPSAAKVAWKSSHSGRRIPLCSSSAKLALSHEVTRARCRFRQACLSFKMYEVQAALPTWARRSWCRT